MNICYFIPSLYNAGGMERMLTIKANYLVTRLKYDVTIVTFFQFDHDIYFELHPKVKIVHFNLKLGKPKNLLNAFLLSYKNKKIIGSKISDFLQEKKFDIVISMEDGPEFLYLPFINDGSIKITEYHFSFYAKKTYLEGLSTINKFRMLLFYLRALNAARKYSKIVVLTNADQLEWQRWLYNTTVIGNPVTIEIGESPEYTTRKKCLAVGRLSKEKGFDRLIEIWSGVYLKNPDWSLDIYGEGNEREHLSQLIKLYGLQDSVSLPGNSKNMAKVYGEADIFLLSSRNEGFALGLSEAMSAGLPAVSFDCKYGPADLIDDEISGFLIKPGDNENFVKKVNYLISNEIKRREIGAAARKKLHNYSLDSVMFKWDTLFKELLNAK